MAVDSWAVKVPRLGPDQGVPGMYPYGMSYGMSHSKEGCLLPPAHR